MSALIASLMREQRAAEDRAIFDAYNNGGKFKGQNVTDEVLLKYITGRRDGFDTQDPLYDEWNNRLIQTKFSIGEKKIGLAYKQGRVGAGAVAAYYRSQLKNIPKNSAFYRDVAGRAAEWAKGASRAARGAARGRATKPLRDKLNAQLYDQQGYLNLEAGLTAYAKAQGLISGSQTLADADASELQAMFARGLYAGKQQITWSDFVRSARGYYKGLGAEIQTRLALGQQGVEARHKRSKFLNETLVRLNVVDERSQYEAARDAWLEARAAAGEDPYANAAADAAYAEALGGIIKNVQTDGSAYGEDPEFAGGLVNEISLLQTGKSNGKTVSDLYDYAGPGSADMAKGWAAMQEDITTLKNNQGYLGQSEPGGAIHVVKWQSGLGKDPLGLDDSLQPSISVVDGEKKLVYMKGRPISASVIVDSDTGELIDTNTTDPVTVANGLRDGSYSRQESDLPVGYMFTDPKGDVKYGVIDKTTGNMVFTDANPWASDVTNVGGELTVFSGGATDRNGKWKPDLNAVFRPGQLPSLDNADPLLADSTVAPSDLLKLVQSGDIKLSDEDIGIYRARLVREAGASAMSAMEDERGKTLGLYQERAAGGHESYLQQRTASLTSQVQGMMGLGDDERFHRTEATGAPPAIKPPPPIVPAPPRQPGTPTAVEPSMPVFKPPTGGSGNPYNSGLGGEAAPTNPPPIGDTPPPGTPIGGR
jgi:hypothetical protein